jgi:small basic protein (TIGR04137 family)
MCGPVRQSGDNAVSIDKSLKRGSRLQRPRNVMSRDERIAILLDEDRWDKTKSVLGLPKTKVPKLTIGRKKKKKAEVEESADDKKKKKK